VDVAGERAVDASTPLGRGELVPPLDVQRAGVPAAERAAQRVVSLSRSGTRLESTRLGTGATVAAVDARGGIAVIRASPEEGPLGGRLELADAPDQPPSAVAAAEGLTVTDAAFGPARALAVAVSPSNDGAEDAGIWLLDRDADDATQLTTDGVRPRWHP
jgi:hypothetical protein